MAKKRASKSAVAVKTQAPAAPNAKELHEKLQNAAEDMVRNGLGAALFGGPNWGIPGATGQVPYGQQISQVTTLFQNNRWYLVSNMRQLLNEIYIEIGLIQTIVDVPVDDGLRGGIEITTKQLSEEQIDELQVSLDRDGDITTVGQALKWNRLFGGAGVIIMTDQPPETPLNVEAITKDSDLEFRAVDMWELFWSKQNTEGYDASLQEQDFEFYDYYGVRLHKSRVMRMKGLPAPSFIRPRLRGWGFSVVESLVRSINQYLKATELGFEVLDEFKVDVFKLKNLTDTLMSPLGDQKVRERVALANRQKNFQHAIVLDSEDEFDHKQLTFSGLAEAMLGIRMQVASDMRMPMTKLFGISAAGFSSGEDDIENYNAMVESQVRNKCKYDLLRVVELKCQKLFGVIPSDLKIGFKPLRVLGAVEEEQCKTQKFTRAHQARQSGDLTAKEFREIMNRENLLGVQLDTSVDLMPTEEDDADEEKGMNPEKPNPDDDGSDRKDSKKADEFDEKTTDKDKDSEKPSKVSVKNSAAKEWATKMFRNSLDFEKAAFEADATRHEDIRRAEFFKNPVDADLFNLARHMGKSIYTDPDKQWQFAIWLYKKRGGKF